VFVGLGDRAGYPLSFVKFAAFGIPITWPAWA